MHVRTGGVARAAQLADDLAAQSRSLHRKTDLLPGRQSAQNRCDVAVTLVQQVLRRTGAGLLSRSGAVEEDRLILGQLREARRQLVQRQRDRAAGVAHIVELLAAHVDQHSLA